MNASSPSPRDFNPYAAPKAFEPSESVGQVDEPVFFAVGVFKLTVMSLVTFGIYEIYWFYQNWEAVNRRTGERFWSFVRAMFFGLMSYSMFRRIREFGGELGLGVSFPAGILAIAIFLLQSMSRLPDPYWLISLLTFVGLLPVQKAVNDINRAVAPSADPNTRFSGWNIMGIVVGGLLLLLVIIAAFLDPVD